MQVDTLTGNRSIAEFMGAKEGRNAKEGLFYHSIERRPPCSYLPTELKYHQDWNWLMEVVDKIESLTSEDERGKVHYVVTIETGYCVVSKGGEGVIAEQQTYDQDVQQPRLVACWRAVLEFITYYTGLEA